VFTTTGDLVEVRTHPQNDYRIQAMWVAEDGSRDETYSVREMPTPVDIHYGGRPSAAWLPDRQEILISDGVRPVIGFYGLDGSLRHTVRLGMEPERVTEAEKQAIVAMYDAQVKIAAPMGGRVMDGYLLLTAMDEETGEFVPTVYRLIPAAEGFVYPH